jgi:hypothetical protein
MDARETPCFQVIFSDDSQIKKPANGLSTEDDATFAQRSEGNSASEIPSPTPATPAIEGDSFY